MQTPPPALRPPLDSYLAWLRGRGVSEATLRAYTSDLRQLDRWLAAGGLAPQDADELSLRRFAAHLGTLRYAPATAARKLSAARGAYAFMLDRSLVDRNPAALVPGPRKTRKLPATLSEPEVERLLDRPVTSDPRRLRDRALLELLYGCGLRASEACGLRTADVNADEGFVRVTGKGGKERIVPLGGAAADALGRYLREGRPRLGQAAGDRVFVSVRGRPLGPTRRPPRPPARARRRRARAALAARPPPHVRHAPARARRGSAQHPGAPRPCIGGHDPGIHACERAPSAGCARRLPPAGTMSDDSVSIWDDYKRTGDKRLRDRLILTYAPLVKYVAGRLGTGLPAHVDEGDLVSYGLLGLMNAIERFDPHRDTKFETYAISRIKGSIIDELRSMDWVPRSVRSRAREIERGIVELEHRLHRPPSDEEIAAHLGISDAEFQDSLTQISRSSVAALDELWTISSSGGDTVSLIDTLQDPNADDPSTEMTRTEVREALAGAIGKLPDREKTVITLYYYDELTLREIGEVLGVTESRVSQLHTKAILRLKAKLQGNLERASAERFR